MENDSPETTCCPPAQAEAESEEDLAALAKAIGHPVRLRILRTLARGDSRVCRDIVCELPLAQSTVSEHLRILKEAGLICSREAGTRVLYCVNQDALGRLKRLISNL